MKNFSFKTSYVLIGFVLMVLLNLNLFSKEKPYWINGDTSKKYNSSNYLTAIGSGKTLEIAISNAKKAIAEIFNSEITTTTKTKNESTLTQTTKGTVEGKDTSNLESDVIIKTNISLRGIQIPETYFGKDEKTYYALAVLNKLNIKNMYLLELNKLKTKITASVTSFKAKASIYIFNELKSVADDFDKLNKEYMIINNGIGMKDPISDEELEKFKKTTNDIATKLTVFIDVNGVNQEFSNFFTACLIDNNIKIITDSKVETTFKVKLTFKEEDVPINIKGWIKSNFTAMADISKKDAFVGKAMATRVSTGRNKEMVLEKAKKPLSDEICKQSINFIIK